MLPCWLQQKKNWLEILKGEYIGKIVHCTRDADSTPKAEDSKYDDIIVKSSLDEIDSEGETSTHIIKRTWLQWHVIRLPFIII